MHKKRKFIKYCWKTSKEIVNIKKENGLSRILFFVDIMIFGFRHNATTIDYMKLAFYKKNRLERRKHREELIKNRNYKNRIDRERIALSKYSSRKYENHRKWHKRLNVYRRLFNMGEKCSVQFNVWIRCTHKIFSSKIVIGNNVSLQRNVDIDYTGGLEIGNNVTLAEGVKVLTHGHDYFGLRDDVIPDKKNVFLTKLKINNNVLIGTRSIIMPGVYSIGENSVVSAGSVVTKEVPANVVVAGNPAKIVAKLHKGLKVMKTNLT